MRATAPGSRQPANMLLAMLPENSRRALPLERVSLQPGMVLYEADQQVEYLYFPDDALISIVSAGLDGSNIEIGLIGRNGMVGVPAILGGVAPHRAVVQTAGQALRMKGGPLIEETYSSNPEFQELVLKYVNAFMIEVAQFSLCNCYHPVQARICRWLMLASDALHSDTIEITHDRLATLLGMRRASATVTIGLLQRAGLVKAGRGKITIVDAAGLEETCCECYAILRQGLEQVSVS